MSSSPAGNDAQPIGPVFGWRGTMGHTTNGLCIRSARNYEARGFNRRYRQVKVPVIEMPKTRAARSRVEIQDTGNAIVGLVYAVLFEAAGAIIGWILWKIIMAWR